MKDSPKRTSPSRLTSHRSVPIDLSRGQTPGPLDDGGLVHGLDVDAEDAHDLRRVGRGRDDPEAPPSEKSQRAAAEVLHRKGGAREKARTLPALSLVADGRKLCGEATPAWSRAPPAPSMPTMLEVSGRAVAREESWEGK